MKLAILDIQTKKNPIENDGDLKGAYQSGWVHKDKVPLFYLKKKPEPPARNAATTSKVVEIGEYFNKEF